MSINSNTITIDDHDAQRQRYRAIAPTPAGRCARFSDGTHGGAQQRRHDVRRRPFWTADAAVQAGR